MKLFLLLHALLKYINISFLCLYREDEHHLIAQYCQSLNGDTSSNVVSIFTSIYVCALFENIFPISKPIYYKYEGF